ncbi:pentatricopeptide repeat-containing protein [Trifolium pratense]|uniref:Pentatricopeptide repeat-containing protein n=1 Tax=Trifolium pratense TaxID=57577 RepID=A0A2K3LLH2_TRIPR|nr:pentatricopeptide repeat-containing protein [Trifolium pratense]
MQEDKLVWKEEQNGEYTVKSGYRILMEAKEAGRRRGIEGSWKCLWQIRAPPKAKHILWRICRDCLPTRAQLRQHYVQCPAACELCNGENEDTWHVLFDCEMISNCWTAADAVQVQQHHWIRPRHGWLKCNVDARFHNGGRITSGGWCIRDEYGQFIRVGTNWMRGELSIPEAESTFGGHAISLYHEPA